MSCLKLIVLACTIYGVYAYTDHPVVQQCYNAGYYYGTCLDTVEDVMSPNSPNRCQRKVRCVGWTLRSGYYIEEIGMHQVGNPCAILPNYQLMGCDRGSCNKTLDLYKWDIPPPNVYQCQVITYSTTAES